MSENIASLIAKIDATSADTAADAMDRATAASGRLETATEKAGSSSRAALGDVGRAAEVAKASMAGLGSTVDATAAVTGRASSAASQMADAIRSQDAAYSRAASGADRYAAEVRQVDAALEAVTPQALSAASSFDTFYDAAQRDFASQYVGQMTKVEAAHTGFGRTARLSSAEALNLSRQVADVGVSLASGQDIWMVAIQQGAQIGDIMKTSGLGFKGLAREVLLMIGVLRAVPAAHAAVAASTVPVVAGNQAIAASATAAATAEAVALAPLGIILAGIAVVLTTLGVGFAVTAQQIDKTGHSATDLQKKLGLTEDQMKRLKKEGHEVGVTMGDVLVGTFDFAGKKLAEAFKWNDLKKGVGEFYQSSVDWTVKSIRSMVGAWAGFQGGLHAVFKALPAVIGEAAIGAVNAAIRAINWVVDHSRDSLNAMIDIVNGIAALTLNPIRIPKIPDGQIAEMANQFAGAGAKASGAFAEGYKAESTKAMAQFDKDVDAWLASIDAAWLKRNKKEAGDPNKNSGGGGSKADPFADTLKAIGAEKVMTEAATKAQLDWNRSVAAGTATVEEANAAREWALEVAELTLRANAKEGAETVMLTKALDGLKAARDADIKARIEGDQIAANKQAMAGMAEQLDYLRLEASLIGAGNVERAVELAMLREKQEIMRGKPAGYQLSANDNERIGMAGDVPRQQAALAIGQDLYNEALDATLDRLTRIDDLVSNSTAGLADAFEGMSDGAAKFTRALGGVLGAVNKLAVAEEKAAKSRDDGLQDTLDALDTGDWKAFFGMLEQGADDNVKSTREMEDAQLNAYANMAGAAKTFFDEGSEGYELLKAAEIAFRAVQFAMSVQAMAQRMAESENSVVAAMGEAVANTIAGAARAFSQMGVYGFIGAGAIIAFMAAVGVNAGGSGGGAAYDLEGVQARQGTGTVLGDRDAKSESIAKSLELVADHTNDMLEYNNGMLRALRNIDVNIGNLASSLARSLNLSGITDVQPTSYNPITGRDASSEINKVLLGAGGAADMGKLAKAFSQPFGSGNILRDIFNPGPIDPLGLFDSKISKKLIDAGVSFTAQSLGSILTEGLKASYFQVMRTTREDKAFGFTYSTSTKDKTATIGLETDLQRQFNLVIESLRTGVLSAASVLGVDGAQAVLDAFQINIGKISFKDMDGAEITATLEAVFSKVGDDMAGAVIPGLTSLQKAGEGLFETLMRVARQYQVIDVTLSSVGMTFGAVGLSSLAARERLVDFFGSLDEFTDQVSFYGENFLTEAERLAPIRAALSAEFTRLGIAGLDTRDEFKQLVQGLDVSTAAGAELFAALMAIAPAFAAVTEETKAVADARDVLSDAYGRESSALTDTANRFRDLASGLTKYRASLYSGPAAALSPEAQYMADKAEFERVAALAGQGNEQALGDLQGVSQAYLDASRAYYASSAGYFADLEAVRAAVTNAEGIAGSQATIADQQLTELKSMVSGILDLNETTLTMAQALANYQAAIAVAFGGVAPTPVVITSAGTAAAAGAGATTPTLPTPTVVNTGAPSNDNGSADVVAELRAMNQALSARLAAVEGQLAAANSQRGAIATEQQDRDEQQIAALNSQTRAAQA